MAQRWAALPAASGATNSGNVFVTLKPPARARLCHTDEVIDRLRPKLLNSIAGARLFLQAGGSRCAPAAARAMATTSTRSRPTRWSELNTWVPKITDALQDVPELEDVNSDQQDKGLEVDLKIDRADRVAAGPDRQPDRQHAV